MATNKRRYCSDPDYRSIIESWTWRKLRKRILSERPLCEECRRNGRTRPAEELHHVVPIMEGKTYDEKRRLALDPTNIMSLCRECHTTIHTELESKTAATNERRTKEQVAAAISSWFD